MIVWHDRIDRIFISFGLLIRVSCLMRLMYLEKIDMMQCDNEMHRKIECQRSCQPSWYSKPSHLPAVIIIMTSDANKPVT